MHQLTQKLKNGKMQILETPTPALQKGQVLIKTHYSLISAGTEGSTVKAARKGYIGKAKERPQQVKQVLDTLATQGPVQTYRAVMKKLDAYSPLGYSCAGEVIDVAPDVSGFHIGDLVGCGGQHACHAEIIGVPANLCTKLDPETDLKQAAYNTLGAIAMQGVRQADLRLGETCAVIGLGLLGQLTALLLKASGVRVVGVDIDQSMVDTGKAHCLDLGLNRKDAGVEESIIDFSNGMGCDAVIITAASSSLDPINFAGAISRKKGSIIVVGAVPTGFDREPHFYKKELSVKMSCSYGPGRYDPDFEEKGIDYPYPYVRWTEKRNMQAFQELIYAGKIDLQYLTTHCFKLEDAPNAYDMIMDRSEPFIGILIEYDTAKEVVTRPIRINSAGKKEATVGIGFIGAGSYAQSHLIPNIPKDKNINLIGVKTATSASSRSVAERYGFEFCSGMENDILDNENINTIFIATRHDTHAKFVLDSLKAGKHVFVEKPICLTLNELQQIEKEYSPALSLMVGYNRRYSPLSQEIKKTFNNGPVAMTYRINAGYIPPDSWIQDKAIGGGRILGEVCHFVDYLTFINGSLPVSVYATAMTQPLELDDVLNVSLTYQNGSVGNISYFSNGSKSLSKEHVEVYGHGSTAVLDDYKKVAVYGSGKPVVKKLSVQDKGQKLCVKNFIDSVLNGTPSPIPAHEIFSSARVCFGIIESLKTRQPVSL
ncbi:bi-domain-containing oxidoreductase [Desulfobacter postgatei]|uniref:bi-domain-containing oxidoreductase n=1 Tax=Desulfobacter postgatei TaxID=2293 RepID=UPI00259BF1FC|nr:bi-domain-containing oxidoreductase [uncultured Desulfobacter sp.]